MTGRHKKIKIAAAALSAIVALILIAAILVVRSDWFRNFVRERIVSAAEEATGGKVELASFDFDWRALRARITGLVIHGNEPPDAAPLFRAPSIELQLKLLSSLKEILDLQYLGVERPSANIMVFPNGRTNIPTPRAAKKASNKSGLETVVDLAVNKFEILDASIQFAQQKTSFTARGEELGVQLLYNPVSTNYKGVVRINPLLVISGDRGPLKLNVSLPLTIGKDKVELSQGRIQSPQSQVNVNGSVERLASPLVSAHLEARVALDEVQRAAHLPIDPAAKGAPSVAEIDVAARMDGEVIYLSTVRLTLGQTKFEASGPLNGRQGSAQFSANLELDELSRLLKVAARPTGAVQIGGNAKLAEKSDYLITGNITTRNVSVRQGNTRLNDISLASAFRVNPKILELSGFRLSALGGEFTAHAIVEEFARFKVDGRLRDFNIQRLARALAARSPGYDGTISGTVQARGDLKAPGTSGLRAEASIAIAPGSRGTPVSGNLRAGYDGSAGAVAIGRSYIALPHSRLDLSGTLGQRLDLVCQSTNLNDFLPAAAMAPPQPAKDLPVTLKGGAARIDATVTGKLDAPQISAHIAVSRFAVEQRPFERLAADVVASPAGVNLQNGILRRSGLHAAFDASVGLRKWSAAPSQPVTLNMSIQNGDLADVVALSGKEGIDLTGTLNATARVSGTIGNPQGGAQVSVIEGTAYQEPFDRFEAQVKLSDGMVRLAPVQLTAGSARVELSGSFTHPRDTYKTGQLQLHVATNQIAIEQFKTLQQRRPGLAGVLQLNASAVAELRPQELNPGMVISAINANLTARQFREGKQNLGDLTAAAKTIGANIDFRLVSDFAGSNIRLAGQTKLAKDYPTTMEAAVRDLPVDRVLQLSSPGSLRVRGGMFAADVTMAGTLRDPRASLRFHLDRALVYNERIDRIDGAVNYTNRLVEVPSFRVATAAGQIDLSASLSHAPDDFQTGQVNLHAASNDVQLVRIQNLQKSKPGLSGTVRLQTDLTADLKKVAGKQQILLSKLEADIGTRSLEINKQPLGNATLHAETKARRLSVRIDSDFASSAIHGNGEAQLEGDYPLNAKLTFGNVTYSGIQKAMGSAAGDADALVEGQVTINGSAMKPDDLRAALQLSRLDITTAERGVSAKAARRVAKVQNQGPILVELDRSIVNVRSFRIAGSGTDLSLGGSASLREKKALNLTVNANSNLALLQGLNPNVYSSGSIALQTIIRGTLDRPSANGKLELRDASVNLADSPNGLSHASGLILLSGNSAVIQDLTGESGGGKISLTGSAGFAGDALSYKLRAKADGVRARYEAASVVTNADLNLTGNSRRSLLAGTVTVQRIAYNTQSDVGSTLSKSAAPPSAPSAVPGPIAGMRLDVRIRTAPDVRFQTTLAEGLQAAADLNMRGTLESPGMVGQINNNRGQMVFFGNQYTVNRGVISFYNPLRIEPVLDINLGTTAKGVDIVLGVTGPVDNMKLTYRSDPPLRFEEIVALLATGKVPTSDPTIAARQPAPPQQSLSQMGESAVISQAVAAPIANRLERVFGVNQLKIDPTFTSGSALPQARVTLQQQISDTMTFTYTTDLTRTNSQILRVEWAFTPRFSAVATRDENGIFGVDFSYKKQFR